MNDEQAFALRIGGAAFAIGCVAGACLFYRRHLLALAVAVLAVVGVPIVWFGVVGILAERASQFSRQWQWRDVLEGIVGLAIWCIMVCPLASAFCILGGIASWLAFYLCAFFRDRQRRSRRRVSHEGRNIALD